jgi:hypothetical protein
MESFSSCNKKYKNYEITCQQLTIILIYSNDTQ